MRFALRKSVGLAVRKRDTRNDDFKAGYAVGLRNEHFDLVADDHPITVEWKRRGAPFVTETQFNAWKRGYWTGRYTAITQQHQGPEQS